MVKIVPSVYVKLENRPGALDRVTRVLAEHHVSVDGMSVETVGASGFVRLVVRHPLSVLEALHKAQVEAFESEVVVAPLAHGPEGLHHATRELAAAGLNVESVFLTREGRVAFRTNDNEAAATVLRKL